MQRVFSILLHLQDNSFILFIFFFPLSRDTMRIIRCTNSTYIELIQIWGFICGVKFVPKLQSIQTLAHTLIVFAHRRVETEAGLLVPVAAWTVAAHDVGEGKAAMLSNSLKVEKFGAEVKQGVEEHAWGKSAQLLTLPQIIFFYSRVNAACTTHSRIY